MYKTTHDLAFLSKYWDRPYNKDGWQEFKVGTCKGLWGATEDTFDILAITNEQPGNGHLDDVMEWFEFSCRRENKSLRILEVWNKKFADHLTTKKGFIIQSGDNLIKHFTK